MGYGSQLTCMCSMWKNKERSVITKAWWLIINFKEYMENNIVSGSAGNLIQSLQGGGKGTDAVARIVSTARVMQRSWKESGACAEKAPPFSCFAGSTLWKQGCCGACVCAFRGDIVSRFIISRVAAVMKPLLALKLDIWGEVTKLLVGWIHYIKGVSHFHFVIQSLPTFFYGAAAGNWKASQYQGIRYIEVWYSQV